MLNNLTWIGTVLQEFDRENVFIFWQWVNFAAKGDPNGPGLPPWPEFRAKHAMLQIHEDGQMSAGPPSDQQLAKFKFLDGFLISASMGQP